MKKNKDSRSHKKQTGVKAAQILKRPYSRILIPDVESGSFSAEILEFPGCIAQGDTPDQAYSNLEQVAIGWIEAALDLGQEIPVPFLNQGFGGKIALRLPRSVHRQAALMAERDKTSLNQFLLAAISERVGATTLYARMVKQFHKEITFANVTMIQANNMLMIQPSPILEEQVATTLAGQASPQVMGELSEGKKQNA